jgi:hypothetical protein
MPTLWPAMVRFVDRGVVEPALEVAVRLMAPLPVPDVGARVAHAAPLDAVHEQFGPLAVTLMVPAPPAEPNGLPLEEASTVMLHAMPASVIWNGCPPMVSPPDRATVVEFAATEYARVPGPTPEAPEVTVIQLGPKTVL